MSHKKTGIFFKIDPIFCQRASPLFCSFLIVAFKFHEHRQSSMGNSYIELVSNVLAATTDMIEWLQNKDRVLHIASNTVHMDADPRAACALRCSSDQPHLALTNLLSIVSFSALSFV